MTDQVFVSYSTADIAIAEQIRDHLESQYIACWMAPRDIVPGEDYAEQIISAIESCPVLLLVLSESSNRSQYVRNEVERAIAKRKVVIPFRIHNVTPSRSLEFFISNAQWIDAWKPPLESHLAPLTTAIRNRHAPEREQGNNEPPLATTTSLARRVQSNLPAQLTRFIGRERAIAEVKGLLENTRLLTLTGSGGTGKTRLALEVGTAVTPIFANGVWLVELAALSDGAMVAETVATLLGLPSSNQPTLSMLTHYLRDKPLLLLLDNCEHLIQACAELAEALLRACLQLHILATSREALGVAGELAWPVPSLQMPEPEAQLTPSELATFEAVRLFIDRAALVSPGFALTAANAAAVRQICARLDGIPLALELAAARVKTLSAEDIAARLGDRFRLLTGGSRTVLPRHQTLRALIDWSYHLLTEAERSVLRRLAVFAGGWTLEAAEATCSGADIDSQGVLDLLTRLVDKSLVVLNPRSEPRRYTMLETIRQYIAEQRENAEESTALRNRHLDYFLTLGERFAPQLQLGEGVVVVIDQVTLFTRLARDLDNMRRALDWATESERLDEGLRLLSAIWNLFLVRAGLKELVVRFRAMLEHPTPPRDARTHAVACLDLAGLYYRQNEVDLGRVWLEKTEVLSAQFDDPILRGWILSSWKEDASLRGDYALAHSYLDQWRNLVLAHDNFGMSEETFEETWAWAYGRLLLAESDYVQARNLLRLSHARQVKLGNQLASTAMARALGYALLYSGDVAEAADRFRESLVGNFALGDKQAVAACLAAWAAYVLVQGELHRAARLFGASEALQEVIYTPLISWDVTQVQRTIATLRQKLLAPELDEHWAAGRALSMEQAMDYALASYPCEQK